MHFFYDRNDEVYAFEYGSQIYYYTKNLQGDVTGIINDEDILICRYEYDDWGKCTVISNGYTLNDVANVNPFRYRSYYYDTETGLYYLQSRYYDPETGRFINCDDPNYIGLNDTAISWNGFAYCENNSINKYDRYGNNSIAIDPTVMFEVSAAIDALIASIGATVPPLTAAVIVIIVAGAIIYAVDKSYYDALKLIDYASTAATPPPPNKGGKGTKTDSKTLYEKKATE